jgi:hypothetical protein
LPIPDRKPTQEVFPLQADSGECHSLLRWHRDEIYANNNHRVRVTSVFPGFLQPGFRVMIGKGWIVTALLQPENCVFKSSKEQEQGS